MKQEELKEARIRARFKMELQDILELARGAKLTEDEIRKYCAIINGELGLDEKVGELRKRTRPFIRDTELVSEDQSRGYIIIESDSFGSHKTKANSCRDVYNSMGEYEVTDSFTIDNLNISVIAWRLRPKW